MRRAFIFVLIAVTAAAVAWGQAPAAFADKPALLTSIGQSADIEMVKVLLNRAKVPHTADPLVLAAQLPAGAKTLVLAVGGSSKGLGAAGISTEAELERAKALFKRARELGMKIIAVHVGGEARRGTLSDAFISLCVPAADYLIVVEGADKDGLFTKLAGQAKIPIVMADKITSAGAPLAAAFK